MIFKEQTKSIPISKEMGLGGIQGSEEQWGKCRHRDQQSLELFDRQRSKELYKLWNRLASGSYFAPAVKRVHIPESGGKPRPLGIPTVSDRIPRTIAHWIEKFSSDSVIALEIPQSAMSSNSKKRSRPKKQPDNQWALEEALEDARLKIVALETMITIAEEQFKIDIRKKSGTKQSK